MSKRKGALEWGAFRVPCPSGGADRRWRRSAFRELEAASRLGAAVFLALDDAAIAGEEAVLFLTRDDGVAPRVFGLNQGVFRVRQDPVTGRRVVVSPVLTAKSEAPERVVRGAASRRPVEIEAFGAQVRSIMAAQAGAR